MVTILTIAVVVLAILVVGVAHNNLEMKQQLELLDKEQHTQNKDIMELMKENNEMRIMLLQHIEI